MAKISIWLTSLRSFGLTLSQIAAIKTIKYLKIRWKKKTWIFDCLLLVTWSSGGKLNFRDKYFFNYFAKLPIHPTLPVLMNNDQIWYHHSWYMCKGNWGVHFAPILLDSSKCTPISVIIDLTYRFSTKRQLRFWCIFVWLKKTFEYWKI